MTTVVLTGASGRLGRVIAADLLDHGYTVAALTHRSQSAEELARAFAASGPRFEVKAVDLFRSDAEETLVAWLRETGLSATALVNNARSVDTLAMPESGVVERSQFAAELELSTIVPYRLTMRLVGDPGQALESVVNMGSQYGVVAHNLQLYNGDASRAPLHYATAKAGLVHMTRELAVRLAKRGVRVNALSLGGVEGRVDEAFKQRYAALNPSGRMLQAEEVPGHVRYLISRMSAGMTGHNLVVDGGWSVW
jgi:hypothetical protein